jgi:hypothetical protein
MGALVSACQRATLFIRKLRGGSQPILVEASNGLLYVLKFSNNLQGPNLLFNEVVGAELFRACGLAVAQWEPLLVSDKFLDSNPGCWTETENGLCRPSSGLCFASRFLCPRGERLLEILPGLSYQRIRNRSDFWLAWFLDVCFEHADNRQAVYREDGEGWLSAFFIDSGHLLGGAEGHVQPHILASRYLDLRIYSEISFMEAAIYMRTVESMNIDEFWAHVLEMPEDWRSDSGVASMSRGLGRLSNHEVSRAIWEMLLDTRPGRNETARGTTKIEESTDWRALLHSGVPARQRGKHGSTTPA